MRDSKTARAASDITRTSGDLAKINASSRIAEAMPFFSRPTAPSQDVTKSDALIAQGQAQEDQGHFVLAEELFRGAVAVAPRHARAHLNLGNALKQQGKLADSIASYRSAIEADPKFAAAYCNLGVSLALSGHGTEAVRRFEQALKLAPDMAQAALYLGRLAAASGDLLAAAQHLGHALVLAPNPDVRVELAELLIKVGRLADARAQCVAALEMAPNSAAAMLLLGRLALASGDANHACTWYAQAVVAAPNDADVWAAYLMTLNVRPDLTPAAIAREHFRFGTIFDVPRRNERASAARRPLRVGYVSGDFKASPVAWFIAPVLERHDPARVMTYCYSNVAAEDEVTARIKPLAARWRSIRGVSDNEAYELIQRDEIDVLVDLSGHTAGNRLALFGMKSAPVQATWLGYLNTTGLKTIDFRITDRFTDPDGLTESLHSEALARMPHSQWCWVPFYDVPPKANFERRGRLVFGSFNDPGKVTNATLDLWASVLRRVPDSEIRIHAASQPAFRAAMVEELRSRGVAENRIAFVQHLPIERYFEAFRDVDIALDTVPYNGGTTTFVTYWMGVPMVALPGERGIARGAYSIAKSAGFDELIANDANDFIALNVQLAGDDKRRVALAKTLRPRLMSSALGDAKRFTRDLETLYEQMVVQKARRGGK